MGAQGRLFYYPSTRFQCRRLCSMLCLEMQCEKPPMQNTQLKSLHSHVRSLGIDSLNTPVSTSFHLVGQEKAREALGIVVDMVRANKFSGRMLVLSGPPSCGKTSAGIAMARELGERIPFTFVTAWEIQYGTNPSKLVQTLPDNAPQCFNQSGHSQAEIIDQAVRKSILVKMREIKDTYEGEVVEIEAGSLKLRSRKGTMTLCDVPTKDISLGDVVYVEGKIVKKLGKCETRYRDNDLDSFRYLPLPRGEVHRKREKISYVSLHDLDHFYSDRLRKEVDAIVQRYMEKGLAEIHMGVLFVDEAQVLDRFSLAYLSKICEGASPLIVLSTNKGIMDHDVLGRAVVIKMDALGEKEIEEIIRMRMGEEGFCVEGRGLVDVSLRHGLRYGLSLLRVMKTADTMDVGEAMALFGPVQ